MRLSVPCSTTAPDTVSAMPFPYEEFDLSGVRTYPLASRHSKARVEDFGRPVERGGSFKAWFDSLPAILGAQDLRRVVEAIVDAQRARRRHHLGAWRACHQDRRVAGARST